MLIELHISAECRNKFQIKNLAHGIYEILDEQNFYSCIEDYTFSEVILKPINTFRQKWDFYLDNEGKANSYGVCDSFNQILTIFPNILTDDLRYIIILESKQKNEQAQYKGWRMSKWGIYIGTQTVTKEYLFDEPVIDQLYTYEVREVRKYDRSGDIIDETEYETFREEVEERGQWSEWSDTVKEVPFTPIEKPFQPVKIIGVSEIETIASGIDSKTLSDQSVDEEKRYCECKRLLTRPLERKLGYHPECIKEFDDYSEKMSKLDKDDKQE